MNSELSKNWGAGYCIQALNEVNSIEIISLAN
jgi:hypothetical protein